MPERECRGCTRQDEWGCHAVRYRDPEPGEDPRDAWINPAHIAVMLDGEEVYSCPRQTFLRDPRDWSRIILYYGFYKNGFLPEAGAVQDQSNSLMQAFRILDIVNSECDEQKRVEQTRPKGDPRNRGVR